ncbi:MAG: hypothetical protein KJ600_02690 [Nanoarchaeota archaeon]|nr:hypothetical protein [Nanoarchaeota archaeon]MBU1103437.1 hypothetical protein [Nanoarchaeota archaeon]
MKKIMLAVVGLVLLGLMTQNVSALYSYESPPRYGGFYTSYEHKPSDYYDKYPTVYRKLKYSGTSEDPVVKWISNGEGWEEKVNRARAAVWMAESYDWRYNVAYGRSSGEVFHGDEKPAESSSNWRYKEAYTPWAHGPGTASYKSYYYEPRYDSETQTFNWKY